MRVTYAPGAHQPQEWEKPMIRIANRYLHDAGFRIGDWIEVEYGRGVVTIRKIQQ